MTTWVLLRGLAREAGHWGGFVQRLHKELADGDALIALDLPGAGFANAQRSPATVAGIATACRAALAARGAQPPFMLVGMSLGAMVAIEWARQAPGEVAGCALINTSLRGCGPFWDRLRPANYGRIVGLLLPGVDVLERERAVLSMTSSRPQAHEATAHAWAGLARERPMRRSTVMRQLAAAARYSMADAPPVPVLLLASAGDRLVSPRCSQRIARRWDVPLAMHPDAGHDLPLDDPAWVVRKLVAWTRAREGRAA